MGRSIVYASVLTLQLILRCWVLVFLVSSSEGQSCGPRVSARLLTEIPCDMSKSSYCTAAGSAYPWQSVKRYIFDNQGLVRRMYGDERHNSVITKEMADYRIRYNPYFINTETVRFGRERSVNGRYKPSRRQPRPQIFTDEPSEYRTTDATPMDRTIFRVVTETSVKIGDDFTTEPLTTSSPTTNAQESSTIYDSTTEMTTSEIPKSTLTQEQPKTETSGQATHSSTEELAMTTSIGAPPGDTNGTSQQTIIEFLDGSENDSASTVTSNHPRPMALERVSFDDEYEYGDIPKTKLEVISDNSVEEKNGNKDYDVTGFKDETKPADLEDLIMEETEEAKLEEIEEDEKIEEAVPRRGINACPVKNEVIAPYWANNTRGDTLALLNVYPFEQYVHFEKCAYENHQMLCREGCRCEQQYRLHRLLAFDPKNECRGIFSDWFRFPSCCVCICYDMTPDLPRSRTGRRKNNL